MDNKVIAISAIIIGSAHQRKSFGSKVVVKDYSQLEEYFKLQTSVYPTVKMNNQSVAYHSSGSITSMVTYTLASPLGGRLILDYQSSGYWKISHGNEKIRAEIKGGTIVITDGNNEHTIYFS